MNRSFESTLAEDLLAERRLFHSTFATADQKESMIAFAEKRAPQFTHRYAMPAAKQTQGDSRQPPRSASRP